MYWYVVHLKHNRGEELLDFFNARSHVEAFVPKIEKWLSVNGKKEYKVKDLYPDYVFIKTNSDPNTFSEEYHQFFRSIQGYAQLLELDDVYALNEEEQQLMEKMFSQGNVIKHSVGNIVDSILKIDEGPLVGLENQIIKINRHKRLAILNFNTISQNITLPLEIVSKS